MGGKPAASRLTALDIPWRFLSSKRESVAEFSPRPLALGEGHPGPRAALSQATGTWEPVAEDSTGTAPSNGTRKSKQPNRTKQSKCRFGATIGRLDYGTKCTDYLFGAKSPSKGTRKSK